MVKFEICLRMYIKVTKLWIIAFVMLLNNSIVSKLTNAIMCSRNFKILYTFNVRDIFLQTFEYLSQIVSTSIRGK